MYGRFFLLMAVLAVMSPCSVPPRQSGPHNVRHYQYQELWGYLMKGEEREFSGSEPFTDILYFGVSVNDQGRLHGSTRPPALMFSGARPRIHLVIFRLTNPAVLLRCFDKSAPVREQLIADIVNASAGFDGIQVDFESLRPADGGIFHQFLSDLKRRIPEKVLSVAVPVRLTGNENAAYDYAALAPIVDRIFVMAYDQHWETSSAGPVAALPWCDAAAQYAAAAIPRGKLVMGIPLYGRVWQDKKVNRSVNYRQALDLMNQKKILKKDRPDRTPHFEYTEKVTVKVFYEDIASIHAKMGLYESYGILSVAFWRIGQGPRDLWQTIALDGRPARQDVSLETLRP